MRFYVISAMTIVAIMGAVGVANFGNKVCNQVTEDSIMKSSSPFWSQKHGSDNVAFDDDSRPTQTNMMTLPKRPSQIYLLGERNSGTKFVEGLLERRLHKKHTRPAAHVDFNASDLSTLTVLGTSWTMSTDIPIFGLKHMFRHKPLNATEVSYLKESVHLLWILVVRNPCDWADAMYRTPWHLCPAKEDEPNRCPGPHIGVNRNATKYKSRLEFFRDMEWRDWQESSIDPDDFTYDSVFDLRRHKLSLMKQLMEVSPHRFHVVDMERVGLQSEIFVQHMMTQFGLQEAPLDPNRFVPEVHHKALCLKEEEWKEAQDKIDWKMEAHFGFVPSDCHMCYSKGKDDDHRRN